MTKYLTRSRLRAKAFTLIRGVREDSPPWQGRNGSRSVECLLTLETESGQGRGWAIKLASTPLVIHFPHLLKLAQPSQTAAPAINKPSVQLCEPLSDFSLGEHSSHDAQKQERIAIVRVRRACSSTSRGPTAFFLLRILSTSDYFGVGKEALAHPAGGRGKIS